MENVVSHVGFGSSVFCFACPVFVTPSATSPPLRPTCARWTPLDSSRLVEKHLSRDRAPGLPTGRSPGSVRSSTSLSRSPWGRARGDGALQVLQGHGDLETINYKTVFYPGYRLKIYESDSTWGWSSGVSHFLYFPGNVRILNINSIGF